MVDGIKTVILAGGKGSRLHDVVKDIPKPMAPVMKKPFLEYIILQSLPLKKITSFNSFL